jgi:pimeloyl-[acyl-carrier protein] methyl ester esterase
MDLRLPRILLLPGMDGSGELFRDFVGALPTGVETTIVPYPGDHIVSYYELETLVRTAIPQGKEFVLLAESYSTPLAIRIAAEHPAGLRALILCSGFASSPVRGWLRDVAMMLPLRTLRLVFPDFMVRWLLLSWDAPKALVTAVVSQIDWVEPHVLAARLREVLSCDVHAALAQVKAPIQYLRAAEDRLVAVECLEEILMIQPGTAVTVLDGPHLLLQREPEACAARVMEFLEQGLGIRS